MDEQIRSKVREALAKKGWSYTALAKASNIPPTTIRNIMTRTTFGVTDLYRIAKALGKHPSSLAPWKGFNG